jgi:subtilase family serine protease
MRTTRFTSLPMFAGFCAGLLMSASIAIPVHASYHFSDYAAHPPLRVYATSGTTPKGITPTQIKTIYRLPVTGGKGTIVIISSYNDSAIAKDLSDFSKQFGLPSCTTANGCFTKHLMTTRETTAPNAWELETALDVEWAHAIAPKANILLVEATTPSGANLLKAVQYAGKQKDAAAISMSWGGGEFPEETTLDTAFKSVSGAPFFAASGDQGTGVSWPAASPNVIAVGGTSLTLSKNGTFQSETAWSGSGGGMSAYEKMPSYQKSYSIPRAHGMRAIPDVSYDADPSSGFPIIHDGVWRTVGGTSAGAPQWAAIAALGSSVTLARLYSDKSATEPSTYFRDIVSGTNGSCGYFCTARAHYDYVTGLGTPQTASF